MLSRRAPRPCLGAEGTASMEVPHWEWPCRNFNKNKPLCQKSGAQRRRQLAFFMTLRQRAHRIDWSRNQSPTPRCSLKMANGQTKEISHPRLFSLYLPHSSQIMSMATETHTRAKTVFSNVGSLAVDPFNSFNFHNILQKTITFRIKILF